LIDAFSLTSLPKVGYGLDDLPEQYGASSHWRMELLTSSEVKALYGVIYERLGGPRCAVCGRTTGLHIHHRDGDGTFCRLILGETLLRLSKMADLNHHLVLCNQCHPKYERMRTALWEWFTILWNIKVEDDPGYFAREARKMSKFYEEG